MVWMFSAWLISPDCILKLCSEMWIMDIQSLLFVVLLSLAQKDHWTLVHGFCCLHSLLLDCSHSSLGGIWWIQRTSTLGWVPCEPSPGELHFHPWTENSEGSWCCPRVTPPPICQTKHGRELGFQLWRKGQVDFLCLRLFPLDFQNTPHIAKFFLRYPHTCHQWIHCTLQFLHRCPD